MNRRHLASAIVLGLVVSALFWIDPLFIPLVLVGPVLTGALAAWRGLTLAWIATLWLVAGIGAVVSDFVANREDVLFHVVLTAFVVAVSTAAWGVTSRLRRTSARSV